MTGFWVLTPAFRLNAQLAIAAARAGETGILDISLAREQHQVAEFVGRLRTHVGRAGCWGVRLDLFGRNEHLPAALALLTNDHCPILVVGGLQFGDPALKELMDAVQAVADDVFVEVGSVTEALAAQQAGGHGVLVKGHEAGGRVSVDSALTLSKQLQGRLRIPYVVQGGFGRESVAAAFLAGAAGVALSEQLWLAREAPWQEAERRRWSAMDGDATAVLSDASGTFRFLAEGNRELLAGLPQRIVDGETLQEIVRQDADADLPQLVAVGRGISQAKDLAGLGVNVSDILRMLHEQLDHGLPFRQPSPPIVRPQVDIAIVGLAAMFPEAKNLRMYWQNIMNRVQAIQEVPQDRWNVEDYFSTDRTAQDRIYSRWGGFLDRVKFDPMKWGIPPASVSQIDPVQLLSLEVAWQAMVDAGFDIRRLNHEKTGVIFAAAGSHDLGTDYCFRTMLRYYLNQAPNVSPEAKAQLLTDLENRLPEWTEDSFPGFLLNVIAGRIANRFNFGGPNFVVDAACAASLAAVHTAVEQLRSGTSDTMLVGAADITNNPFCFMSFAKTQALSPQGRSRPFDDSADGIVLGEGIGAMLLKRLSDAERDGDKIYAVIKGIGCSSDGRHRSLTAPYPPGQMQAVARAYEDARFSPSTVTLIEAHATGTPVGDRVEVAALSDVLSRDTARRQFAALGSVKSMIGHTKTAAGLASLIKTALALRHQVLPATLGVEVPKRDLHFEQTPFYVNSETRPWLCPQRETPRRAGVSGFGFGGTNFHIALEEYRGDYHDRDLTDLTPRSSEVFAWSGPDRQHLLETLTPLSARLENDVAGDLAQWGYSVVRDLPAATEPVSLCRLSLTADSPADLRTKLLRAVQLLRTLDANSQAFFQPSGIYYSEAPAIDSRHVCFLYPGQGSQDVNMLRDLLVSCRWAQDWFAEVNEQLAASFAEPLADLIYPRPAFEAQTRLRQKTALNDTRVAQPALGAVEVFATELLQRFGLKPGRVAGHSYGEYVALWAAGVISRADLIRLSAERGRITATASDHDGGTMAAVSADAETTQRLVTELGIRAVLANLNAPQQTIIAGPEAEIAEAVAQFPAQGVRIRRIPVTAAFHTAALRGASEEFSRVLKAVPFQRPQLPVSSNTLGNDYPEDPAAMRSLLAEHLIRPVLFEQQIRRLHEQGCRVFVEVGPGSVLSRLVEQILADAPRETLTLDAGGVPGWSQFARLLTRAWSWGLPVDLRAWYAGRGLEELSLEEWLAQEQAAHKVQSTDWVLTPVRAVPAAVRPDRGAGPTPGVVESIPNTPHISHKSSVDPSPLRIAEPRMPHDHSKSNPESEESPVQPSRWPQERQPLANLYAAFRELQGVQATQQRLLERLMSLEERLLFGTDTLETSPDAKTDAQVPPSRPPLRRPPIVVPVDPLAAPSRTLASAAAATSGINAASRNGESEHKRTSHVMASPPSQKQTAIAAASNSDGPPSREVFRRHLLEAISDRTGYPIDTLAEDLPLEAGLGIDSIKTVEVFSRLKPYHGVLLADGGDEDELLSEFTQLKTIGDILAFYQERREQLTSPAPVLDPWPLPTANSSTVQGALQRFELEAVAASIGMGSAKKKHSPATG